MMKVEKQSCNHPANEASELSIRPYSKSELARAYAPEIGERSALNRLSRWIRLNQPLWRALLQTGYRPAQQILTCKQVELVFEYLGRP